MVFNNWVTADGSSGFKAEPNRYHMYVVLNCPFAARCTALRKLKGLEDIISMDIFDYVKETVWEVNTDRDPKCTKDTVNNLSNIKEIFEKADPNYKGAYSVPVLWDKQKQTIVSQESGDIMKMFNSEFNEFITDETKRNLDLFPKDKQAEIDTFDDWLHSNLNMGVYNVHFGSKNQESYQTLVKKVFDCLDTIEDKLSKQRYLFGNQLTIADIRLFGTTIRFDVVYHHLFNCNKKYIYKDYPNIWAFTREIYQMPGMTETVDFKHIRHGYYRGSKMAPNNPNKIVPLGPILDCNEPHGREKIGQ